MYIGVITVVILAKEKSFDKVVNKYIFNITILLLSQVINNGYCHSNAPFSHSNTNANINTTVNQIKIITEVHVNQS